MIKIRKAVKKDTAALAGLATQLGYPTTEQQSVDRLSAIIDSNDHLVFVACLDEGTITGYVHTVIVRSMESASFAEIIGFIVGQEYRNQGLGGRLLAASEQWAKERGVDKLRVRARSVRESTHRFYERKGFVRSKEQYVFDKSLHRAK